MVPDAPAAGGAPAPAAPEPPAGIDILERSLRGLARWVRVARGGLAALALLALYGGFRGLSAAQGSPATLQVGALAVLAFGAGLIALVVCLLLGPVARVLAVPPPGAGRPKARLEAVIAQQRSFWRQAGPWSLVLLALVAAAAGVIRLAAAPGSAAAATPEPPPLYEDLDRACGEVPEGTLCFALARYVGGRLAARSDWQTIPVSAGETERQAEGHRLTIHAKGPDGVAWRFGFKTPEEDPLREGLYHVAAENRRALSPSLPATFFPLLPPGRQLAKLQGQPPHPRTWEECPRLTGRLQVHRLDLPLDGNLRAVRADFERACLDGSGAWVAVGRFSFRRPGRAGS